MKNKIHAADVVAFLVLVAVLTTTVWQGHRSLWAWNLPATALLSWLFLRVLVPRMPASLRIPGPERKVRIMALAVVILFGAMQLVMVLQPGQSADMKAEMMVVSSLFYVVAGLVLPKVQQNRWLGVRVPWTRLSAETWAATHRVAGATMLFAGLLGLALCAGSHAKVASVPLAAGAVLPILYSWWHYAAHHKAA